MTDPNDNHDGAFDAPTALPLGTLWKADKQFANRWLLVDADGFVRDTTPSRSSARALKRSWGLKGIRLVVRDRDNPSRHMAA